MKIIEITMCIKHTIRHISISIKEIFLSYSYLGINKINFHI